MRRISATVVGRPVSDEDLADAAEQLAAIADSLDANAASLKRPRSQPDRTGHPSDFFPTSPMIGYANPLAPPVELWTVLGEDGQSASCGDGSPLTTNTRDRPPASTAA